MGLESPNRWQTRINAALLSAAGSAFLATECRAEHVGDGSLISPRVSEVNTICAPDGDFIVRAGGGIWHPFRRRLSEGLHFQSYSGGTRVDAPERSVEVIGFARLLDELAQNRSRALFMAIDYEWEGAAYRMVCPSRYINFPGPDAESLYLQPMSGPVLFRAGGRYQLGYVVARLDENSTIRCEIVLRVPCRITELKLAIGGPAVRLVDALATPFSRLLMTDAYAQVVRLDGARAQFFTYVG